MALFTKLNRKAKTEIETGLSANNQNGGRFFNKNGNPSVEVKGISLFERLNIYHTLLSMNRWKFLFSIIAFFVGINLLFALLYLLIGVEHLAGMNTNSTTEKIGEAFFFSAQTFTTVGYGRISPVGFITSFVASLEALTGLMSFALVTGLLYGRFARPRSYIKYSTHALFAPFKGGNALMFRFAPYTHNILMNVEVKVTAAMKIEEDGVLKTKFLNVPLDISKAITLSLNWTIVHPINDDSPFYGLTKEDIANAQTELLIFVQGFDESFSNTVISRSSYTYAEFIYGAKFVPMFKPNANNTATELYMQKLDTYELVDLPVAL